MVRKLVPLALVVFALAAVPVAFGDDGSNPAPGSTAPAAPAAQGQGGARQRLENLRNRIHGVELRFAKNCRGGASSAPQQCVAFAQKVEAKLQQLDTNVQARIAKLQACTTTSTDAYCKNADKKIALLQKVDQRAPDADPEGAGLAQRIELVVHGQHAPARRRATRASTRRRPASAS